MSLSEAIMGHTLAYRLWQMPFTAKKFRPVLAHNDLTRARRVLDVACGPGTSTAHFQHAEYLGIDLNERYIRDARRRYRRDFRVADVTTYTAAPSERYDFILVNSFLHHIDTPTAIRILSHLNTLLTDDGHIHILDLVLPEKPSLSRTLALADRGKYPRTLQEWKEVFSNSYDTVLFEPFPVKQLGITLIEMVYFKGRAKR
jgi:SAM-dependent methyltransferase